MQQQDKMVTVEIVRVYRYRKARVNGVKVPREIFRFVQDELGPFEGDNHQVVVARLNNGVRTYAIALYFTDATVVGREDDVAVGRY